MLIRTTTRSGRAATRVAITSSQNNNTKDGKSVRKGQVVKETTTKCSKKDKSKGEHESGKGGVGKKSASAINSVKDGTPVRKRQSGEGGVIEEPSAKSSNRSSPRKSKSKVQDDIVKETTAKSSKKGSGKSGIVIDTASATNNMKDGKPMRQSQPGKGDVVEETLAKSTNTSNPRRSRSKVEGDTVEETTANSRNPKRALRGINWLNKQDESIPENNKENMNKSKEQTDNKSKKKNNTRRDKSVPEKNKENVNKNNINKKKTNDSPKVLRRRKSVDYMESSFDTTKVEKLDRRPIYKQNLSSPTKPKRDVYDFKEDKKRKSLVDEFEKGMSSFINDIELCINEMSKKKVTRKKVVKSHSKGIEGKKKLPNTVIKGQSADIINSVKVPTEGNKQKKILPNKMIKAQFEDINNSIECNKQKEKLLNNSIKVQSVGIKDSEVIINNVAQSENIQNIESPKPIETKTNENTSINPSIINVQVETTEMELITNNSPPQFIPSPSCSGSLSSNSGSSSVQILSNIILPHQSTVLNSTPIHFRNPNANSTMYVDRIPWRSPVTVRNSFYLSTNKSNLPVYDQDMVINAAVVEKAMGTPEKPPKTPTQAISTGGKRKKQDSILSYFNSSIPIERPSQDENRFHSMLFDADQLSPIKSKRNVLKERNVIDNLSLINEEVEDSFSFLNAGKAASPIKGNKPTRLSVNEVKRAIFGDVKKTNRKLVAEGKENVEVEQSMNKSEELVDADGGTDGPVVGLFEDLIEETVAPKVTYGRTKARIKRVRYASSGAESEDESTEPAKHTKKRRKDVRSREEDLQADKWAAQLNQMFEEVDKYVLNVE